MEWRTSRCCDAQAQAANRDAGAAFLLPFRDGDSAMIVRMSRLVLALACLFAAACAEPGPPVTKPVTNPAPKAEGALTQRCSNERYGFSVSYPASWSTNDGSVLPACSVFHPAPIQLPRESEIPFDLAVVIGVENTAFDPAIRSSQWERVISTQRLVLDGRNVVRVESEATGEGLAERGMQSVRYVVDPGKGRTLIATTNKTDDSYARNQDVLARMVATISIP